MHPETDTKAASAKYLRDLADKIESGKATCYAVAHLELCDKCPEQHAHVGTWIEPSLFNKIATTYVGAASMVHGVVLGRIGQQEMARQLQSAMAEQEARRAVKQ